MNGYDYTVIQIAVAFVMIILISLLTKPPDKEEVKKIHNNPSIVILYTNRNFPQKRHNCLNTFLKLNGLTYWTRYLKPKKDYEEEERRKLAESTKEQETEIANKMSSYEKLPDHGQSS